MTSRSGLFALVSVFVAGAACSSANAGFTPSGQGGAAAAGQAGSGASGLGAVAAGSAGMGVGGASAGSGGTPNAAGQGGTSGAALTAGNSGAGASGAGAGGAGAGGAGAGGGAGAPPTTFCAAGALRCSGRELQNCNASGSAWLYSMTCNSACDAGQCTGTCAPGAQRCNAGNAEVCAATGSAWNVSASCAATFCDQANGSCALNSLDVSTAITLDGDITVQGALHVHAGGSISSPSGNLTLRADSISVDSGGALVIAATGLTAAGKGGTSCAGQFGAGGGAYGSAGAPAPAGQNCNGSAGNVWGLTNDALVAPGSPGGDSNSSGANGGGVLRLIARSIDIAGQVSADGAAAAGNAGGGSGGGVLLAASESLTVSGGISVAGGAGSSTGGSNARSGSGGFGRVKLLYGSAVTVSGSIIGTRTDGLLPPLTFSSTSEPDSSLSYNDDFTTLDMSWNRPFDSVQGYYGTVDTVLGSAVTAGNGTLVNDEQSPVSRDVLVQGANYVHLVPVNAQASVGAVQSWFKVQLNTLPPVVSSSSHPSQTTWYANKNAALSWLLSGVTDASLRNWYYVLDHFGSTVPTKTDLVLDVALKQTVLSNLDDGIWGFHVVSVDTQGHLTRAAGHYTLRIGADPGSGSVSGRVTDSAAAAVVGASVTLNRGLLGTTTTAGNGVFTLPNISAGTWELTVVKAPLAPVVTQITVVKNTQNVFNATLN